MLAPDDANRLAQDHLGLVGYRVNAVMARVPPHVNRDDLTSAGYLALVKASRQFNPDLGVPFSSYASTRIHGALLDELRAVDFVSRQARQRANAYIDVRERLRVQLGRDATVSEIATSLGVAESRVVTAEATADLRTYSLDETSAAGVAMQVPDEAPDPEAVVLADEQNRYLQAAVQCLPDRLRYVIEQVYLAERPVADVAEELGVTSSRVSQLRSEGIALLRQAMNVAVNADVDDEPEVMTAAVQRGRAFAAAVATRAAAAALSRGASALEDLDALHEATAPVRTRAAQVA